MGEDGAGGRIGGAAELPQRVESRVAVEFEGLGFKRVVQGVGVQVCTASV